MWLSCERRFAGAGTCGKSIVLRRRCQPDSWFGLIQIQRSYWKSIGMFGRPAGRDCVERGLDIEQLKLDHLTNFDDDVRQCLCRCPEVADTNFIADVRAEVRVENCRLHGAIWFFSWIVGRKADECGERLCDGWLPGGRIDHDARDAVVHSVLLGRLGSYWDDLNVWMTGEFGS